MTSTGKVLLSEQRHIDTQNATEGGEGKWGGGGGRGERAGEGERGSGRTCQTIGVWFGFRSDDHSDR